MIINTPASNSQAGNILIRLRYLNHSAKNNNLFELVRTSLESESARSRFEEKINYVCLVLK
jgi:hypothetical protein